MASARGTSPSMLAPVANWRRSAVAESGRGCRSRRSSNPDAAPHSADGSSVQRGSTSDSSFGISALIACPGRAATIKCASPNNARQSCHVCNSRNASAPSNHASGACGPISERTSRRVSTEYEGPVLSSSRRSTCSRGCPSIARSSIAARCSALAPGGGRCGGSADGSSATSVSNNVAAASATARCPLCTGSNVPPYRMRNDATGDAMVSSSDCGRARNAPLRVRDETRCGSAACVRGDAGGNAPHTPHNRAVRTLRAACARTAHRRRALLSSVCASQPACATSAYTGALSCERDIVLARARRIAAMPKQVIASTTDINNVHNAALTQSLTMT
jgi:hypothetical protein